MAAEIRLISADASDARNGRTIAREVEVADSFFLRSKGLLGRSGLADGSALWITRCNSIHTFFMRFAIDAVFVDADLAVVSVHENLRPWRLTPPCFRARSVLELSAGSLQKYGPVRIGDRLVLKSTVTGGGSDV